MTQLPLNLRTSKTSNRNLGGCLPRGLRSSRSKDALLQGRLICIVAILCLAPGCSTFEKTSPPLVPTEKLTRIGQFDLYSGRSIPANSGAVSSLSSLESDLAKKLGTKPDSSEPPVEIYVLRDREAFTHFLRFYFPELPSRRAFFLAQGSKRVIYTYENDRLQEDLRHEATHALLHESFGDLPLWLDEGLAEYFEVPVDSQGVNAEHLARLPTDLQKNWRPDLERLESLKNVKDMTPRDYRESWAWIHFLLDPKNDQGQTIFSEYLAEFKVAKDEARPLSARFAETTNQTDRMLTHLRDVFKFDSEHKHPLGDTALAKASTVRLQNATIDNRLVVERKGLLNRFFGFFGLNL